MKSLKCFILQISVYNSISWVLYKKRKYCRNSQRFTHTRTSRGGVMEAVPPSRQPFFNNWAKMDIVAKRFENTVEIARERLNSSGVKCNHGRCVTLEKDAGAF